VTDNDKSSTAAAGPFRVALIGYGVGGAVFHAPLVSATFGLELAAIVTNSAERVAKASKDFPEAKIFADTGELFAHAKNYDLVIVCSPNRYHFAQAKAAMEAGLHVVVDKPITVTSKQCEELIAVAQKQGKMLTAFQNRRLDGDFLTVQKIIEDNTLGQLVRFESRFDRFRPTPKANAWREKGNKEDGGGLLFDLGSHLIDQTCHLFGQPVEVYCELDRRREGVETDDDCFIALKFASGLRAHLHASVLCRLKAPRFTLQGTRGSFQKFGLDRQEDTLRAGLRPKEAGWSEAITDSADSFGHILTDVNGLAIDGRVETSPGIYEKYYADIVDCIRSYASGVPLKPAVRAEEALRTIRLIEAAYQSASENKVITIKDS
jgi:scyllo-inositol 2-dehydrogenase (NADP+)